METLKIKRNVSLYKWFVVLIEPLFIGPTLIFYLQHVGKMSLSHIYIMEAIVVGGFVLLEVPSGALADLIGRKKTIFLGALLMLGSKIVLTIASSPSHIWISNILWMVSLSMRSGADSAFLYDSLKEVGREDEYKKIEGRAFSNLLLVTAFCSILAGVLSKINLRLPFILSIPGVLISCVLVVFFKEPIQTEKYNFKKQMEKMKFAVSFAKNHKTIKWVIGFSALISVSSKIWFFTYNPYFELVKFDLVYYGVAFFFFNIIACFFSRHADDIEKKVGEQLSMISMILLIGVPMLAMGLFVSKIMISMTFIQNIVRGLKKPLISGFINNHINSGTRATVLSIESAVAGFVGFFALNLFGILLKLWPLSVFLQVLGISVLIIGFIQIIQYRKILKK